MTRRHDSIRLYLTNILAIFVLFSGTLLAACSPGAPNSGGQKIPVDASTPIGAGGSDSVTDASTPQSGPSLSEGQAQPQPTQTPAQTAPTQPLADDIIAQILSRLPAIGTESGDQVDFNLAQGPVPPPRTGNTIKESFPPAENAAQPTVQASGPLEVLRYSPEGEISIAPFVSVTFNQAMVPLTTIADLAEKDVPVKISPSLQGTWRWVGTKTLTFEYDSTLIDRLPKATAYTITVPAGTKSVDGGNLERAVEWKFTTPPVKMISSFPNGIPQPNNPVFFVAFDQRITPAAILETIHVNAGNRAVSLALANDADIKNNDSVSGLVKNAQEGRWLAFKATEPLPLDTDISVTIGPGTPSAEGPLLSAQVQSFNFHTYSPLRITDHGCSWSGDTCRPLTPLFIRFNNPIDPKAFQDGMLQVKPDLPGVSANIYGDTITIQGQTQGRTTYTVTVDGNIQDVFGQKLGQSQSLTFKIGPADPILVGPEQPFLTLDPAAAKPIFSVYTINYSKLDVQIYAVQPSDWLAFKQYLREYQQTDKNHIIPGRKVFSKTISVDSTADKLTQVDIDLQPYMDGSFGHFIVIVAPNKGLFSFKKPEYWEVIQTWVQVTQIGLDAFVDHSDMVAWATALKDGSPLTGVSISAGNGTEQGISAENGIAHFAIPNGAQYLVATKGADKAILPYSVNFWDDSSWQARPVDDELRWYVFDDRQMYRPGEEVHVKGWLRRVGGKQDGDVSLVGNAVTGVSFTINDPLGNNIGSGSARVDGMGGFDLNFKLPDGTNLGSSQLILQAEGGMDGMVNTQYYHPFQVQEFRRPEFEVTAQNETAGPYFAGDQATVSVSANYYAGGPLPGADVSWQVTTSPSSYSPPNWPDFTFGTWTPWWYFGESAKGYPYGTGDKVETFTGQTDAEGKHYLKLNFDSSAGPRPVSVAAQATVMDVNRQAWTGSTNLLVHPANIYVGLHSDRYFVERGTPLKIDFIVTDLEGKPVTDHLVDLQAARLEWKNRGGSWSEEEVDIQKCSQGSQDKPVTCTFETPVGGTYRITATITDDHGRKNQTQITRWVSGGQLPPARKVEQEKVTLIPDKESYQPGDTAEILVQSPFTPAEGLLTVTRSGILYTQRFQIQDGTATLKVPIEEKYIPNLNIQVDLNGSAPRTSDLGDPLSNVPPRPAFATGSIDLKIPPLKRTLSIQVSPEKTEIEPGGETSIHVSVKDASSQPVSGSQVAVVVVDEAILALTQYKLADPVSIFYTDRPADLLSQYIRSSIILVDPLSLAQTAQNAADRSMQKAEAPAGAALPEAAMPAATMAPQAKDGFGGAAPQVQQPAIRTRIDFNPLAAFSPAVSTDANGEATISIKLPDNLTRYRVMAVAVDNSHSFGSGESNLTARLPLMVRPSAPRFLNFGDQFELPVVLQNQTGDTMVADVAVRTANIDLTGSHGYRVTIPAHDRVEVRFPASALKAGTARFQIAAVSGNYSDAAEVNLPVYTPATTEAFATYGTIDDGAINQPVAAPKDVFTQFGGLEITTSSTALQALTDAVLYLVAYPFECSEQLSSRILGVAALRDVLTAFKAEGLPEPKEMEAAVQRDITRLQGMQNNDGGFPYWRQGQDTIPYNTVHVAHALARASQKGFEVPADMQQRVLQYLQTIESHYPSWYSEHTRNTISAYALYVRNLMGDKDVAKAQQLLKKAGLENLDLDAIGWIWPVLSDSPAAANDITAIRKYVGNRVVETAGAANFTTSYDDQSYLLLNSDRRTDAILLDALIADSPKSDLIPKIVTGLLAHREKGRWGNTQENVFVLLALDRYFNTYEAQTPDFVARIWLGDGYAGTHEYHGRTTERQETTIPMSYLSDAIPAGTTKDIILSKEGTGRLYYRLGLSYAPTDLTLPALDMGFVVQRKYEAVDNPSDVRLDENGVWHIKAGAKVRVNITMVASNRRYHVALTDPLPAGLEIVNPALAVSGSTPQDPNSTQFRYGWWWWGTWYEHQNMRDERAEAFTSLLWDGVYNYSYIARATTPGRFVVPPAKAEEMYSPEVFGRSASNTVVIED
jgi:alpha-2-macroglobulin